MIYSVGGLELTIPGEYYNIMNGIQNKCKDPYKEVRKAYLKHLAKIKDDGIPHIGYALNDHFPLTDEEI